MTAVSALPTTPTKTFSKQDLGSPGDCYFKAGAYIQDNYGPKTEGGRVTFYWLNSVHR